MICTCGRDMWLYDSNTWTCKSGHREPFANPRHVLTVAPPAKRDLTYVPVAVAGGVLGHLLFSLAAYLF